MNIKRYMVTFSNFDTQITKAWDDVVKFLREENEPYTIDCIKLYEGTGPYTFKVTLTSVDENEILLEEQVKTGKPYDESDPLSKEYIINLLLEQYEKNWNGWTATHKFGDRARYYKSLSMERSLSFEEIKQEDIG